MSASLPPASTLPSLSATVEVETPELVVFSYTLAGVGARATAAIIDTAITVASFIAIAIAAANLGIGRLLGSAADAWAGALLIIGQFAILWGYYVLFEGLWDGQTPGKRILRLRVVRDGGYSVTFGASAVRNLVRLIDMQPFVLYGVGIVSAALSKSGKRVGDMVAGTIVVRESLVRRPTVERQLPGADAESDATFQTALTEEEYAVLTRFLERARELDPERRTALATQLADRFRAALPPAEGRSPYPRLMRLHEHERVARARGIASRRAVGAARERHAIVAAGTPRWNRFASRLAAAQRSGLQSLGEDGLREFVAEYRELAADLARLRTATRGSQAPEMFYLGRLVAGAHNLLYKGKVTTARAALRFVVTEAPAEVRRSVRPILLAALMLFGPAAIAYTAVVQHPEVASVFIPEGMLERARQGVERARTGDGYIQDPEVFRPVMASGIIANNVQVTFAAFAGGVTAGLMTVWMLVMNGIFLGGVFGLYATKKIARLLLAFVAPHIVLELTAICIAGGAGLLLAAAIFLPGIRTRRAALVENGRRAIRLIGASTVLLVVAGTLEGFVSPIPWWPLEGKLAVSALTAMALYFYLRPAPRRAVAAAEGEAPGNLLSLGAESKPAAGARP